MMSFLQKIIQAAVRGLRKATIFLILGIVAVCYWLKLFLKDFPTSKLEFQQLFAYGLGITFIIILLGVLAFILSIIAIDRVLINSKKVSVKKMNIIQGAIVILYCFALIYPGYGESNYCIRLKDETQNYVILFESKTGIQSADFEDAFPFKKVFYSDQTSFTIDASSNTFRRLSIDPPRNWGKLGRGWGYNEEGSYDYSIRIFWNKDSIYNSFYMIDSLVRKEKIRLHIDEK